MRLSEGAAHEVYDVLVKVCGADEAYRDHFVMLQTSAYWKKWRFMGTLGIGGVFWHNHTSWYVSTYPEAMTEEREVLIDAANQQLDILFEKYTR